jgi:hypothetical protein
MKENSVVLVVLLLSVGVVIGLTLWNDHGGQDDMWSPNDMYSKHDVMSRASSTFTSASASSGSMSNGGVVLTMHHRSFGSSRAHVPSYAHAYSTPMTSGQGPVASSGGIYTTSSSEFRSFGGGGLGSGASMSASRSATTNGAIAQTGGVYTTMPTGVFSSSLPAANSVQMPNSADEMIAMNNPANNFSSASASAYSGWGKTTALYGTATYGGNGSNRISGRRNSDQGSGNSEGYQSWLDWMKKLGFNVGNQEGSGNTFVFSTEQAYEAFLLWFFMNHGYEYDPNNQTSQITYEEWVRWYSSNGGVHTDGDWTFKFSVPVGDVLPMIFFILMYLVFVGLRRYKQLQKSIK